MIAAVNGWALGGGCELAMALDMIVAGRRREVRPARDQIGIMPGAGGTQRLTRAIGKAKAMEMILTGRTCRRGEAEARGLVCGRDPGEPCRGALALAAEVATKPPLAVRAGEGGRESRRSR